MEIAIDGPVASGKGTVSRLAATELDFLFVDTGAMFRAIALLCYDHQVDPNNESDICQLISSNPPEIQLRNPDDEEQDGRLCTVLLNGEDVSWKIREETVEKGSSLVARYICVRDLLVDLQREIAKKQSVIMEGRDIGTFVLPNAELKIFLTASLDERANRRFLKPSPADEGKVLEQIKAEIQARDEQDSSRLLRPLKKADDAIEIDTSKMTAEEVAAKIVELAHSKQKA